MKSLFGVSFEEKTIIATKTTLKKASTPNSPEYKMLMKLMKQHPTYSVVQKDIKLITSTDLLYLDSECVYYRVNTNHVGQTHEKVSREEYAKAWKIFWDCCEKGMDSCAAYHTMYHTFGGVPRKQRIIATNVFYKEKVDWVSEQLCYKIEREISSNY